MVTKCDKEAKDIYYEEVKVIDAIREKSSIFPIKNSHTMYLYVIRNPMKMENEQKIVC